MTNKLNIVFCLNNVPPTKKVFQKLECTFGHIKDVRIKGSLIGDLRLMFPMWNMMIKQYTTIYMSVGKPFSTFLFSLHV